MVKTRYESIFFGVTAHFTLIPINVTICIALRFPSQNTGVKIAELLQRIVAEWEYHVINLVFTDNRSNMVAAFKANDNNDDIAESDGAKALH